MDDAKCDASRRVSGVVIGTLGLAALVFIVTGLRAQGDDLGIARYDERNQLLFPEDADVWIHLGSTLGGEYNDEPFNPADPGTLGVVQMEPQAYRYFQRNRTYADGTMFLLSFYEARGESDPQLPGFVQGDLQAREIHVIDASRYNEGRAFFLFPAGATGETAAEKLPEGSACVQCHIPEGDFNGTFTQFYPPIRDIRGQL
jgi:hypothetical protein